MPWVKGLNNAHLSDTTCELFQNMQKIRITVPSCLSKDILRSVCFYILYSKRFEFSGNMSLLNKDVFTSFESIKNFEKVTYVSFSYECKNYKNGDPHRHI